MRNRHVLQSVASRVALVVVGLVPATGLGAPGEAPSGTAASTPDPLPDLPQTDEDRAAVGAATGASQTAPRPASTSQSQTPEKPRPEHALAPSGAAEETPKTPDHEAEGVLPTSGAAPTAGGKAISLPTGAGTIDGMGESFSMQLSTGVATFSVPIKLPAARGRAQPSLGLSYSSSGGFEVAGVGWSLSVPFIARQTDRGAPRYDDRAKWHPEQDRFVYNGGQELVPICRVAAAGNCEDGVSLPTGEAIPASLAAWQYFRPRVEGSFLRFFWSPDHKTWRVQSKNGVTMEFGVATSGVVGSAVEANPDQPSQIFKWYIVRQYDMYGTANPPGPNDPVRPANVIQYRYLSDGQKLYLQDVYDTPAPGDVDTLSHYAHHTALHYISRTDPTFSYRSGFRIEQKLVLDRIDVTSKSFAVDPIGGAFSPVRSYQLTYDSTRHVSLLSNIEVSGKSGGKLPKMVFSYTYVGSDPAATFQSYEAFNDTPSSIEQSPDHGLDEQSTDLFDVNSDGLPDVLSTSPVLFGGNHGVWFNGGTSTTPRFSQSQIVVDPLAEDPVDANVLKFGNSNVVSLDVDGDGRADFVHMPQMAKYSVFDPRQFADGTWHWVGRAITTPDGLSPKIDFTKDAMNTRLIDVNFDGLVDVVVSTGTQMQTFFALGRYPGGDGQYGQAHWDANANAWKLSTSPVTSCLPWSATAIRLGDSDTKVADMNGDAIPDIVRVRPGEVRYWPGRGNGFWGTGDPATCPAETFGQGREIAMTSGPKYGIVQGDSLLVDDVNGDGLADIVEVRANAVDIYLNKDGKSWTSRHVISGTPPSSEAGSGRVRLIDINGSGTSDVLWGNGGAYQYIDLMGGQRPWMLVGVQNGLGKSTALHYTTSTALMLAAEAAGPGSAWTSKMPSIAQVVDSVTESDNLKTAGRAAAGKYTTQYSYRDPVYDGRQREFRGFRQAVTKVLGDSNSPTDVATSTFLLGECVDENPADAQNPCAISNRASDNPREALKGLAVLVERSDGAATPTYMSTDVTHYTLRQLYSGLDGRAVRDAFADQTFTYLYDTSPFTPSTLPETVNASVADAPSCSPECPVQQKVSLRSASRALTSTTKSLDPFGNETSSTSLGCIGGSSCTSADEPISTFSTPQRDASDPTGWLFRTVETYVTGAQARPIPTDGMWKHTTTKYNAQGDPTNIQGYLEGALPLKRRDESSAQNPPLVSQSPGYIDLTTLRTYDDLGNLVGELTPNKGCRAIGYSTDAFRQFATSETVYPGGCNAPAPGSAPTGTGTALTTAASYNRGFGNVETYVDAGLQTTTTTYDEFGRQSSTTRPDSAPGSLCTLPSVQITYDLATPARPYSIVHTSTQDGLKCSTSPSYRESYAFVDGLGRTFVTMNEADPIAGNDGGAWIVSGLTQFDDKRALRYKYLDFFTNTAPSAFATNVAPTAGSRAEQRYDAFARKTSSFDIDGTETLRMAYHALSTDASDAVDLTSSLATPVTERRDGHGRAVETIERFHTTGYEERSTRTEFNPLNLPERITRHSAATGEDVVRWFRYDTLGRVVMNVEPNTSTNFTTDKNANVSTIGAWRYAYDVAGNLAAASDARGCGVGYFYDGARRILKEDYFPCETHHVAYTPTAPNATDPTGAEVLYEYDAAPSFGTAPKPVLLSLSPTLLKGRLVRVRDRASDVIHDYDARGRESGIAKRIAMPDVVAATGLASRFAPRWYERTTAYDSADRPVTESTGVPATGSTGNVPVVAGMLGSDGKSEVKSTYTARGILQQATSSYGGLVKSLTKTADGLTSQVVYQDLLNTHTDATFDSRRRPATVKTSRTTPLTWVPLQLVPTVYQAELQNDRFSYDAVSNPTSIEDMRTATAWPAGAKPVNRSMVYDELYRVKSVTYDSKGDTWTSPFGPEDVSNLTGIPGDARRSLPSPHLNFAKRMTSQSFSYDWRGNTSVTDDDLHGFYDRSLGTIVNGAVNAGPYQVGSASNQSGPGTYKGSLVAKYDASGNMTRLAIKRSGLCSTLNCNQWFEYSWDEMGRLARARRWDGYTANPSNTATPTNSPAADLKYAYDGNDDRVLKVGVDPLTGDTRGTAYIFGSLELRGATLDAQHNPQFSADTIVVHLSAAGVKLGRVQYYAIDPVSVLPRARLFLEMTDHLGSATIAVEAATSELAERATFQAYGGTETDYRPTRWQSVREEYKFTGKEEDVEVGLQYFGKRYLNPALGRWLSPDPLALHSIGTADPNLYAYVAGRALLATDPRGLESDKRNSVSFEPNQSVPEGVADASGNIQVAPTQTDPRAKGGEAVCGAYMIEIRVDVPGRPSAPAECETYKGARDYGHAMVALSAPGESRVAGFVPTKEPGLTTDPAVGVPGKVETQPTHQYEYHATFEVTRQEYNAAKDFVSKVELGKPNWTKDFFCTDFALTTAKQAYIDIKAEPKTQTVGYGVSKLTALYPCDLVKQMTENHVGEPVSPTVGGGDQKDTSSSSSSDSSSSK